MVQLKLYYATVSTPVKFRFLISANFRFLMNIFVYYSQSRAVLMAIRNMGVDVEVK